MHKMGKKDLKMFNGCEVSMDDFMDGKFGELDFSDMDMGEDGDYVNAMVHGIMKDGKLVVNMASVVGGRESSDESYDDEEDDSKKGKLRKMMRKEEEE